MWDAVDYPTVFPAAATEKHECPVSAVLSLADGCHGVFELGSILLQNSQVTLSKSHNRFMHQLPFSKIGMITTQNRFEALKGNYDVWVYVITFF